MGFNTTRAINMVVNLYEKTDAITIFDAPHSYFGRWSCQYCRCSVARESWASIKTNGQSGYLSILSEMHRHTFTITQAVLGN